ncbi:hypothetical protein ACP70R_004509 [Stipagrostis hirtigluma subsp. patula]
MDGRELEEFVFWQCPRWLDFHIKGTQRVEAAAPCLERLSLSNAAEAYIAAPNLEEVVWEDESYDPQRHRFAEAGRHLRRLVAVSSSLTAALMRQFDSVNELIIDYTISHGPNGYKSFLEDVDMLPNCEVLVVQSTCTSHCTIPSVLHLLRKSTGIKKFVIYLESMVNGVCRLLDCPCDLPESCGTNDINLDSLNEIEINLISNERWSDEQAEILELLLGCNAPSLRKVVINLSCKCPFIREDMCEKIREMCLLSNKFEFCVVCTGEEWGESYSTVVIHISIKHRLPVDFMTFASLLEHEISHVD